MLTKIFGDDEPDDLEEDLRNNAGDIGLLLTRGVPAALGVDVSGKFGFGNAFSILPYTDIDFSKGGYEKIITALSGPAIGGLGARYWQGIGQLADGKPLDAAISIAPNGVRDALKAVKTGTQGVTRANGDVVIGADELDAFDSALIALGFPPTKLTERQYKQAVIDRTTKFLEERHAEIKKDYAQAYRDGDSDAIEAARLDWSELQDIRTDKGFSSATNF